MKIYFTILFTILFSCSYAQEFYDLENIQTIEVTFAEANWDQLMDIAASADSGYIMAQSVTINGVEFDSVGVKFKGNSSYSANQVKNPWHIELDTYKEQDYDGYTDIKLGNGYKDPSMIREPLAYQILRQYMDAPEANYANLYVNGNLIGLYANQESISKKFMGSRFGSRNNTRFKCSPPDGAGPQAQDLPDLVYLGQDSTDYYGGYEIKSDAGWQELIDLCDTLENNVNAIEEILDVDRALWMLAFNNVFVNLDSYLGQFQQNYYLYRNDAGQFMPIVWDLNESFGVFSQTGTINLNNTASKQQMTHLLHVNDSDWPLVQNLLSNPTYKNMYIAHMKTMLLENFDNGSYYDTAETLQETIDASVQADNNKFFTYNNFLANLDSDVSSGGGGGPGGGGGQSAPGIAALMNGRTTYLLSQSDFTAVSPTIGSPELSNSTPQLNETIVVTAVIADETNVILGYRNSGLAFPFNKVQMFDDGTNGDVTAGDGIYSAEITLVSEETQYFIYAENDDAGLFSPRRAEYEYHTINTSYDTSVDGLVINEFMASNDVVVADQDEEFDDWIELYNNAAESIDLSGYLLSDDADDLAQWSFPEGTSIEAGGYITVWLDDDEDQEGLHANFKLSSGGESIFLSTPSDSVLVDALDFPEQETDISYGRYPNGIGDFQFMEATYGAENQFTSSTDDQLLDQAGFNIYPNPTNDFFIVEFDEDNAKEKSITIYSIAGKVVYQEDVFSRETIDTYGWAPGTYIVKSEGRALKLFLIR